MLSIQGLSKTYRDKNSLVRAIRHIDLNVQEGEFLVLLGSSGCGKTTTLRCIAGLEKADSGEISIDGRTVFSKSRGSHLPPEKRPIGMVFQSYAIWPHMAVYDNVALPLRKGARRIPKTEIEKRVRETLLLLGLEEMIQRPVTTLSGGQQQRVALARAIALQPKVLLMDEPLSNLDFKLRVRLRVELKELVRRLGLTTIYVTHDQEEALEMGDTIAVMNRGGVVQLGPPRDIYESPQNEFVARFIGDMNLLTGVVEEVQPDRLVMFTPIGKLLACHPQNGIVRKGESKLVGIRPEDICFVREEEEGMDNVISGFVVGSKYLGESVIYTVKTGEICLNVKSHHGVVAELGETVCMHLQPKYSMTLDMDGQLDETAI